MDIWRRRSGFSFCYFSMWYIFNIKYYWETKYKKLHSRLLMELPTLIMLNRETNALYGRHVLKIYVCKNIYRPPGASGCFVSQYQCFCLLIFNIRLYIYMFIRMYLYSLLLLLPRSFLGESLQLVKRARFVRLCAYICTENSVLAFTSKKMKFIFSRTALKFIAACYEIRSSKN